MSEARHSLIRTHLGSLALAFAIIFAAGVFGFVTSKAFAIFFLCFVGFLVLAAIGLVFMSNAEGWPGAILAGLFLFAAIAGLISGIDQALDALRSSASTANAAASLQHN